VKKAFLSRPCAIGVLVVVLVLSGCGTPSAKNFGGPWRAVNRYQSSPTAIPLSQPYVFFATPMDGTLKNMLARWAKDTRMSLSYQLPCDYTLYTPVSGIHTSRLRVAAAQLNTIYAPEDLHISIGDRQIVVEQTKKRQPTASVMHTQPPGDGQGMNDGFGT
jgi:hypothetical protein